MLTRISRQHHFSIVIISLLALLLGFLLVGCSADGGGQGEEEVAEAIEEIESEVEGALEEPIDTIEVNETEFSLDPANVTLDQPGTYVFRAVNSGDGVHALEIEGEGIEEETVDVPPGESTLLRVNLDPGTYTLYCPVGDHEERGMRATITVRAS
jgi:plastocyanin